MYAESRKRAHVFPDRGYDASQASCVRVTKASIPGFLADH
jgi:hypothetical protein